MEPTNFTESNALLALVGDDEVHAAEIIREMLPGERQNLKMHAYQLARMCGSGEAELVIALFGLEQ